MEEIWNKVKNYENYEVSNLGGARSLKFGKVRILKPNQVKGYLLVDLCKDGKGKWFSVHRLVWEAFNGPIPEGMQVNHINEDKTDNRLENLNLMTPKENSNWGTRNQRHAKKQKGIKRPDIAQKLKNGKRSKCVYQYTLDGVLVKIWPSTMECERNGFYHGAVSKCCNGKLKQYKGFIWKYK